MIRQESRAIGVFEGGVGGHLVSEEDVRDLLRRPKENVGIENG